MVVVPPGARQAQLGASQVFFLRIGVGFGISSWGMLGGPWGSSESVRVFSQILDGPEINPTRGPNDANVDMDNVLVTVHFSLIFWTNSKGN